MIHFIEINSSRFISSKGKFSLIKHNDSYQILLNSRIPSWNYKFSSVECAEKFLNSHDYIHASLNYMPMSSDDIEYIIDMYGFDNTGKNRWIKDDLTLSVNRNGSSISISDSQDKHVFKDAIDAIDFLDNVVSSIQIIRFNSLQELKQPITAARSNRRSPREITQNLVRVKSSNIWGYAIDIRDRHDKTGTLYIQFKGRNGGPGDIYCYYDVSISDWRKLISGPSAGHAFWALIRNRYNYSKLTGDKRGKLRNAVN